MNRTLVGLIFLFSLYTYAAYDEYSVTVENQPVAVHVSGLMAKKPSQDQRIDKPHEPFNKIELPKLVPHNLGAYDQYRVTILAQPLLVTCDNCSGGGGGTWGSITGTLSSQTDLNTALGLKQAGPLTGDVTTSGAAATIANLAVTNAKIAASTIDLTTKVTGILPPANGGAPPVTRNLHVDCSRTDTGSYTADGSPSRPFALPSAAVTQIITNADNSTHPYRILIEPGTCVDVLSFNSALLYDLTFEGIGGSLSGVVLAPSGNTAITSTSNNTNLGALNFFNLGIVGDITFTGDINNTNFASNAITFNNVATQGKSAGTIVNNVNNIYWYNSTVQATGGTLSLTNVSFAFIYGGGGHPGGTLTLVQNNGTNNPAQSSGNYLLMDNSKDYAATTIDAGSEMDMIQNYIGSNATITNNGTIHSFQSIWESGTNTLNSGSTTRVDGDLIRVTPVGTSGVVTDRGNFHSTNISATTASNLVSVGTITTGTWSATTIATTKGGTGVTSVTTSPTASSFAGWDANSNLSAKNHLPGFTTAAAASTTTNLVVGSTYFQAWTGSTSGQIVGLPVASTLAAGQPFFLLNNTNQTIQVNTSGGNAIKTMAAGSTLLVICVNTAGGTGTASWYWQYTAALNN